jgi:hypothetical protein
MREASLMKDWMAACHDDSSSSSSSSSSDDDGVRHQIRHALRSKN